MSAARRLPRHPRVWWSRIKYRWPFLVWIAAIWGTWHLYQLGIRTVRIPGTLEALREEAAPVEDARLASIHVNVGDVVVPGQILARFDTSVVDAQLSVERLQAERQFMTLLNNIATRRRDLEFRRAADTQRVEALEAELRRLEAVVATGVEDAARIGLVRAEIEALRRTLALYPPAIAELEREEAEVRERWRILSGWLDDPATTRHQLTPPTGLENVAYAVSLLRARRENFILRARHTGTVTRIWFQVGDVVRAGTPTVTILIHAPPRVIGFMSEFIGHSVTVGQEAFVERAVQTGFGRLARARIESISPDITWLPTRVSPLRNQPVRGRRVVVTLLEPTDAYPGEAVNIYVGRPWWNDLVEQLPESWKDRLRRRDQTDPLPSTNDWVESEPIPEPPSVTNPAASSTLSR